MFANVTLSLMGGFCYHRTLFLPDAGIRSAARPAYQLRLDEPHYTAARTHQNHRLDRPRHAAYAPDHHHFLRSCPLLWDISLPRFTAALVAFVINYACYFSEIFRGGIQGIPSGQYEAGQVLGMTKSQIFFKVTLLQVIKRVIPPMGNEFINLVKDTALARTIAVYEVLWMGEKFIKSAGIIWPLFYTAVFYLLFNGILTLLFGWIEKKMDYFK